jgi:hypothetical protein
MKGTAIENSRINQAKIFNLFFMIPPFMIKKILKNFGEIERYKQGSGNRLLRNKQIVNQIISDFVVRIFLTGENIADLSAYRVLSGTIL